MDEGELLGAHLAIRTREKQSFQWIIICMATGNGWAGRRELTSSMVLSLHLIW